MKRTDVGHHLKRRETAMSHTVPSQHPAVVLRSNYQHLRALLAVAFIAIVGLTIAVVVLATSNTTTITPAAHQATPATSAATQHENQLNRTYFYSGHY
jgi:hypothetical protein